MNRRTLTIIALASLTAVGCKLFQRGGQGDTTAVATPAQPTDTLASSDTTMAAPAPAPVAPAPAPVTTRPAAPARPATAVDEPWTPTQTGTISPGMDRDQVIAVWGKPVAERADGNWTYLYFRNGCEASCGTFDVVFLEDGKVVDAIVRGAGHTYDGTSSSPPGRKAEPTIAPAGGTAE
jgi:hypothetical protein